MNVDILKKLYQYFLVLSTILIQKTTIIIQIPVKLKQKGVSKWLTSEQD